MDIRAAVEHPTHLNWFFRTVLVVALCFPFATGCGSDKKQPSEKQPSEESPKATFERMVKAVQVGDWSTFYDIIDDKAQKSIIVKYELDEEPRFKGMQGKPLFLAAMTSEPLFMAPGRKTPLVTEFKDDFDFEVTKVEEQGDRAKVSMRNKKSGREEPMQMNKQDGQWRLQFK